MKMKHILVLIGLFIGLSASAQVQELQGNYNVADYFANDSTTFFLSAAKNKKMVMVDFTTVDKPDIEFRIGAAFSEKDGSKQSTGYFGFTPQGTTTVVDSIILDTVAYVGTVKTKEGTRYTTNRIYLEFPDGIPTDWVGITFFWGTAEAGRVKVYF